MFICREHSSNRYTIMPSIITIMNTYSHNVLYISRVLYHVPVWLYNCSSILFNYLTAVWKINWIALIGLGFHSSKVKQVNYTSYINIPQLRKIHEKKNAQRYGPALRTNIKIRCMLIWATRWSHFSNDFFLVFSTFVLPIFKQACLELNYIVYEQETPPVVFKLDSNCS